MFGSGLNKNDRKLLNDIDNAVRTITNQLGAIGDKLDLIATAQQAQASELTKILEALLQLGGGQAPKAVLRFSFGNPIIKGKGE